MRLSVMGAQGSLPMIERAYYGLCSNRAVIFFCHNGTNSAPEHIQSNSVADHEIRRKA